MGCHHGLPERAPLQPHRDMAYCKPDESREVLLQETNDLMAAAKQRGTHSSTRRGALDPRRSDRAAMQNQDLDQQGERRGAAIE